VTLAERQQDLVEIDGIRIRTVSPLALYQLRLGISSFHRSVV
jgi:hypothetical protein